MDPKQRSELIIHPVRLRITALLSQKAHTAGDLSAKLNNVPQATLYRHIKKLETAGIIKVVESYQVRGTIEKVYGLKNETIGSFSLEDMKNFTVEDHERLFAAFTSSLNYSYYDFLRTLETNPKMIAFSGYHSHSVKLNPEDLPEFKNDFIELLEKYRSRAELSNETKIFQFSTVIIPEASNESE